MSTKASRGKPIGNVLDLQSVEDVTALQADMLERLRRSTVDPDRYAGLADCRHDRCGRVNCLELCRFGARCRRSAQAQAIYDLFKDQEAVWEVRLIRPAWARPIEELGSVSLVAARHLNRRLLDRVVNADVLAVGLLKVAVADTGQDPYWSAEIHQIVAGVDRGDLYNALGAGRARGYFMGLTKITPVDDLLEALSRVLADDLQGWHHPYAPELDPFLRKKKQRSEFYKWLLGLGVGERLVRYGCDRYFRNLDKPQKPIRAKVKKKRPYPYWLQPYMFGNHPLRCACRVCSPHLYFNER